MGRRNRRRGAQNPGPEPTEPHRENVPGPLDHASGDEEVFEAGIVSGGEGEPLPEIDEAELEAEAQAALGRPEDAATAAAPARAGRAVPGQPTTGRGGSRVINFFKASWAELQRVQWPDRRQVAQATAVVLGFVVIAGAYLGLADAAAQKIIDFIL
jgi:preprotein translocase subunit SecE